MKQYGKALKLAEQGRYIEADMLLTQLDIADPNFLPTLYLKSAIQGQLGAFANAAALSAVFLSLVPDQPSVWGNLSNFTATLGYGATSLRAARAMAILTPVAINAKETLAVALINQGQIREAEQIYAEIIQLSPCHAPAHGNLAEIHRQAGKYSQALQSSAIAICIEPNQPNWYNALAASRINKVPFVPEHWIMKALIRLTPVWSIGLSTYAASLLAANRPTDAIELLYACMMREPGDLTAHINLGSILLRAGCAFESKRVINRALKIAPNAPAALMVAGNVYSRFDQLSTALHFYAQSLALAPQDSRARLSLANTLLKMGNYREGCKLYESRIGGGGHLPDSRAIWPDCSSPDDDLLIFAEQGLGDVIQFARFIEPVRSMFRSVTLAVPPTLQDMLSCLPVRVIASGAGVDKAAYRYFCPIMSLPYVLGLTLADIRGEAYLTPNPQQRPASTRLRVGIAPSGNANQADHAYRVIPTCLIFDILGDLDVEWHILQPEINDLGEQIKKNSVKLHQFNTIKETAEFITTLDLVISACTSVAHLSGAIGHPTWVLLAKGADWRWLTNPTHSPWYDSVRLFRQNTVMDWHSVLLELRVHLQLLIHKFNQPATSEETATTTKIPRLSP